MVNIEPLSTVEEIITGHTSVYNMVSFLTLAVVNQLGMSQISEKMRPCEQCNREARQSLDPVAFDLQNCPECQTINPLTHHIHTHKLNSYVGVRDKWTIYVTTHTHPFNGSFPEIPRWASTRKVKPIWILLKQETVSGSGISRAVCKSAPRSRQITMPAPHCSVFYRPDALPVTQPTASKH